MIHGVIFYAIHCIFDILNYFQRIYRYIWINFFSIIIPCTELNCLTSRNFSPHVKRSKFKKLPSHIGIVIVENIISLSDVSELILWCLYLGIRHVSIYDLNGYIKNNGSILHEQTIQRKKKYFEERNFFCKVTFNFSNKQVTHGKATNGHHIEHFDIHLISKEDGRRKIIQAAQLACFQDNCILASKFHAMDFDPYLRECSKVPDPELVLRFGPLDSLIGYLPWHIRLSEILSLPTHHNIQFYEFLWALKKYEECEQRFGK